MSKSQGHISINLTQGDGQSNIVDTGYGVSQILPVLAQIWWARVRPRPVPRRASVPTILAIEQPELHLHPAHQALLADALVGEALLESSEKRGRRVNFLVETHSETLINRLGELVAQKKISPKDIQVILFEPIDSEIDRITVTNISTFNADGSLTNWPYGFFQAVAR